MKYAVIRTNGKQYKTVEGDQILVDRIKTNEIKPEVLLVVDGDKIKIGKPLVNNAKVTVKYLGEEKGKKIEVIKYKAKSRYRKHIGFTPKYSKFLIEKIG